MKIPAALLALTLSLAACDRGPAATPYGGKSRVDLLKHGEAEIAMGPANVKPGLHLLPGQ